MCYKDRWFCPFQGCTKWEGCQRALTPAVRAAAVGWWVSGGGKAEDVPIDSPVLKPKCFIAGGDNNAEI